MSVPSFPAGKPSHASEYRKHREAAAREHLSRQHASFQHPPLRPACPYDFESPLNPLVLGDVNARPSIKGTEQEEFPFLWGSAQGTGGFHFPTLATGDKNNARSYATLKELSDKKRGGVNMAFGSFAGFDIFEHKSEGPDPALEKAPHLKFLHAYDVNSKLFVSGLKVPKVTKPPPKFLHWLKAGVDGEKFDLMCPLRERVPGKPGQFKRPLLVRGVDFGQLERRWK